MGDSAHTTHHTNPGKKSAPPLFLEDENIFQKSASVVPRGIEFPVVYCMGQAIPHEKKKCQKYRLSTTIVAFVLFVFGQNTVKLSGTKLRTLPPL